MSIFKACDIRGQAGTELTGEVAYDLGRAVGSELPGQTVVVGGDVRPSTGVLKPALIAGLVTCGCRVLDLGTLPTPAFYFAKDALNATGGVMVTGSHNPPADNGFKLILGRWPVTDGELAGLARRMAASSFVTRVGGSVQTHDIVPAYKAFMTGKARELARPLANGTAPSRSAKVVVDAGNGCYSRIAPDVLRDAGYEIEELFCEPDGTFPNRSPNPSVAGHLDRLSEAVVRTRASLGVAYDGDGDRAVFMDEQGHVLDADRTIVLLARYQLASPDTGTCTREVVYDIKCSSIVPDQVRAAGGIPIMEKSGHVFIKTALLQRRAILGGEISGHFFFGELGGDDGLYATLLMLQVLEHEGRRLAELAAELPRYPITPDLRFPCPSEQAQVIVQQLAAAFVNDPRCEVSMLDGTRVAWADGWALARCSVTEPLITLRFEAHTPERLAEIRRIVEARVPALSDLHG